MIQTILMYWSAAEPFGWSVTSEHGVGLQGNCTSCVHCSHAASRSKCVWYSHQTKSSIRAWHFWNEKQSNFKCVVLKSKQMQQQQQSPNAQDNAKQIHNCVCHLNWISYVIWATDSWKCVHSINEARSKSLECKYGLSFYEHFMISMPNIFKKIKWTECEIGIQNNRIDGDVFVGVCEFGIWTKYTRNDPQIRNVSSHFDKYRITWIRMSLEACARLIPVLFVQRVISVDYLSKMQTQEPHTDTQTVTDWTRVTEKECNETSAHCTL